MRGAVSLEKIFCDHWGWTLILNKCLPGKELKMGISKELLEILACPKCKGEINLTKNKDGLVCDQCKLLYQIKDDIPIMLIDEAISLTEH